MSNNTAVAEGGGVLNSGETVLNNTTLSGNTAAAGGGLYSWINGTATLNHCTISDNTATGGSGGGLGDDGSGVTMLTNSIVAHSSADTDCALSGTLTDGGYNIVEDGTCITAATSSAGDPLIGVLQDNGGPTLTHAPLPGGPAVDAIPLINCTLDTDQRGVPRPQGSALCDIGAVEFVDGIPAAGLRSLLILTVLLVLAGTCVVRRRSA